MYVQHFLNEVQFCPHCCNNAVYLLFDLIFDWISMSKWINFKGTTILQGCSNLMTAEHSNQKIISHASIELCFSALWQAGCLHVFWSLAALLPFLSHTALVDVLFFSASVLVTLVLLFFRMWPFHQFTLAVSKSWKAALRGHCSFRTFANIKYKVLGVDGCETYSRTYRQSRVNLFNSKYCNHSWNKI